jgi:hypothetical protein
VKVEFVSMPARPRYDLRTTWRLACPCGSNQGSVIGHPIRLLKAGAEDSPQFVSPFSFKCGACGKRARFLDTAVDGTGAELGRLAGSEYGCAVYRGSGRGRLFLCPGCGTAKGEVLVRLYFNQDYMYALQGRGVEFPRENLFSGVHVFFECSGCGERSMVTDLDTKY